MAFKTRDFICHSCGAKFSIAKLGFEKQYGHAVEQNTLYCPHCGTKKYRNVLGLQTDGFMYKVSEQ